MPHLKIKIKDLDDKAPSHPHLNSTNSTEVQLDEAVILENGMTSGSPSVTLLFKNGDHTYFAQTSPQIITMLLATIRGAEVRFQQNRIRKQ
jgi:hypothetical protein